MTTNPTTPDHAALRGRLEHLLRSLGRGGAGLGFNADLHEEAVVDAILLDPGVRAALAATSEPPTADATPRTEAGKRLMYYPPTLGEWALVAPGCIAAIEAEARADALAAVRKRVEGLPFSRRANNDGSWRGDLDRAAVLTAIREEEHRA